MDGYHVSLPAPDRLPVERAGDRRQGSQGEQHPREKKKKKKKLLPKTDEVILSDHAPLSNKLEKTSEKSEPRSPDRGKGDAIDITA